MFFKMKKLWISHKKIKKSFRSNIVDFEEKYFILIQEDIVNFSKYLLLFIDKICSWSHLSFKFLDIWICHNIVIWDLFQKSIIKWLKFYTIVTPSLHQEIGLCVSLPITWNVKDEVINHEKILKIKPHRLFNRRWTALIDMILDLTLT